jgi:hypothetical protein
LCKKYYKKISQGETEQIENHGEFFKGLIGDYKTPFKLRLLRLSLWGITSSINAPQKRRIFDL